MGIEQDPAKQDHTFQRHERLRKAAEFSATFQGGIWGVCNDVRVVLCRNDGSMRRFGLAVSKQFGNAVQRNLIKRRMREALRVIKQEVPMGIDCILLPSKRNKRPEFEQLRQALPKLIQSTLRRLDRRNKQGRDAHARHKK